MARNVALSALLALLVGACVSPTPYAPAQVFGGLGYSEERLEDGNYRVAFYGNSLTDVETVDAYLLRRAAELTLENGHDYFTIEEGYTDADIRLFSTTMGNFARYTSRGLETTYHSSSSGIWNTENNPHIREIARFDAEAVIAMGSGELPDHKAVFNARGVLESSAWESALSGGD